MLAHRAIRGLNMSFSTGAFSNSFGEGFDRVAPPVVTAPTVPGIEYTMRDNRLHYTMPENRLHYTIRDEDG